MTAELLGPTDANHILDTILPALNGKDKFFSKTNASVMRTGSDHGADWYVITGLTEANRFADFVLHVQWADDILITVLQIPEDGDSPVTQQVFVPLMKEVT